MRIIRIFQSVLLLLDMCNNDIIETLEEPNSYPQKAAKKIERERATISILVDLAASCRYLIGITVPSLKNRPIQ